MEQTLEQAAKAYAFYERKICPPEFINQDEIREESFKGGAQWQKQHSPWISVKDQLPVINYPEHSRYFESDRLLLKIEGEGIFLGYYIENPLFPNKWFHIDGPGFTNGKVTHWMVIPSIP